MTYVLIWWLAFGSAVATHSQEFATEAHCEVAKDHMTRALSLGGVTRFALICVRKGRVE